MSAPENRERRRADTDRWIAARRAAQEHRAGLPPIDPNALRIGMGGRVLDGHGNPVCERCERGEPVGLRFGVVVDGVGRVCGPCAESTGRRGEALVQLVEAVEDLDSAIAWAPPEDRSILVDALVVVVGQWLPDRFGPDDPARPR